MRDFRSFEYITFLLLLESKIEREASFFRFVFICRSDKKSTWNEEIGVAATVRACFKTERRGRYLLSGLLSSTVLILELFELST